MEQLTNSLTAILIFLVFIIMILVVIYLYMTYKSKQKAEEKEGKKEASNKTKIAKSYTKNSIFDFMEFDKIEDNMIIQDNGTKYLMVIECEGVNYDLMSGVEKAAVETGFVQFLNTLRYPIQIYTQTRTINISDSINGYKNRLEKTQKELTDKQKEYNTLIKLENYDEQVADSLWKDIIRLKNLYEYGLDVVEDTQKLSNNKNVLRKYYYIVVPYYATELGLDLPDTEKRNMIFSDLYTRAQSVVRALFSCEIKSKVLDSNELVKLLYVAYNRDDSNIYDVDKALRAGYSELYSTSEDALEKEMKAIDKKIKKDAQELANSAMLEAKNDKARKLKNKKDNMEELIKEMAAMLLKENEKFIGKDVAEEAIKKVKPEEKEGGNLDEQKERKSIKRASRKSTNK